MAAMFAVEIGNDIIQSAPRKWRRDDRHEDQVGGTHRLFACLSQAGRAIKDDPVPPGRPAKEGPPVSASFGNPDQMFALQKRRLGIVIRLTQENAMVLTLQQRVAGKEIEVMVAERMAQDAAAFDLAQVDLAKVELAQVELAKVELAQAEILKTAREHAQMQELLEHHERTVAAMDASLKQIDSDIAALCQS